jgi:HAD superfamily hydrolase (TIGR01549 family)
VKKPKVVNSIIWDYDGTLVDTRKKNLSVTKEIVTQITRKDSNSFPTLQSLKAYEVAIRNSANWRDLYKKEFHFTDEQTDNAGKLWSEYQFRNNTIVSFYDDISDVIKEIGNIPQGIVSQNSHHIISNQLLENELIDYFEIIIGYEEVDFEKQKPQPDGLIMCIEKLTKFKPGCILYIGDHETDAQCAFNANQVFKERNINIEVLSVGAFYGDNGDDSNWTIKPNFKANKSKDILKIINTF